MDYNDIKNYRHYDLECFPDYFLAETLLPDESWIEFENPTFRQITQMYAMKNMTGFNNHSYDDTMIAGIYYHCVEQELALDDQIDLAYAKKLNDQIINNEVLDLPFNQTKLSQRTFDVMKYAKSDMKYSTLGSLKSFENAHGLDIEETPIPFDKSLTQYAKEVVEFVFFGVGEEPPKLFVDFVNKLREDEMTHDFRAELVAYFKELIKHYCKTDVKATKEYHKTLIDRKTVQSIEDVRQLVADECNVPIDRLYYSGANSLVIKYFEKELKDNPDGGYKRQVFFDTLAKWNLPNIDENAQYHFDHLIHYQDDREKVEKINNDFDLSMVTQTEAWVNWANKRATSEILKAKILKTAKAKFKTQHKTLTPKQLTEAFEEWQVDIECEAGDMIATLDMSDLAFNPIDKEKYLETIVSPNYPSFSLEYNGVSYDFGLGGSHGFNNFLKICEGVYHSDWESLYPNLAIIIRAVGDATDKLKNLVTTRLKAKHAGDIATATAYKIIINAIYGLLRSINSGAYLYDKHAGTDICILGQMVGLSMCLELEKRGAVINQNNTDGYMYIIPNEDDKEHILATVKEYEAITGMNMATDYFDTVISRDVNNYFCLDENNEIIEAKGALFNDGKAFGNNQIVGNIIIDFFKDRKRLNQMMNAPLSEEVNVNVQDYLLSFEQYLNDRPDKFATRAKCNSAYEIVDYDSFELPKFGKRGQLLKTTETMYFDINYNGRQLRGYPNINGKKYGRLKKSTGSIGLISNTPERISKDVPTIDELDKQYYIDLVIDNLVKLYSFDTPDPMLLPEEVKFTVVNKLLQK